MDVEDRTQSQPTQPVKGRGSVSNSQSRYIQTRSVGADDGWASEDPNTLENGKLKTELFLDRTVNLITRNQSPDIPFAHSINPYKGCEHGCIYCFARPTHAYLDLSPGRDFETKIFRKVDARQHLLIEMSRPNYVCSPIAMGTNTDPYQPFERTQRVTREILETLLELRHPVTIVTKSKLILRDLDLLTELARDNLISVNVSVTTLSNDLKTKLEPRTSGPAARLRTIAELKSHNIPVGAMLAPIIPFINDHEIEDLVEQCAQAGARELRYILVRLPLEVAPLFEEWLQAHYPGKAKRVLSAIRDTRGGELYKSEWGKRMVGEGEIAQLIRSRFKKAARAHNVYEPAPMELNTSIFKRPPRAQAKKVDHNQLSLF